MRYEIWYRSIDSIESCNVDVASSTMTTTRTTASIKCARAAARILTHLIYTYNICSLTRCRVEDTKLRADKHDFPLGPHNSDLVSFTRAPGPISQYIAILHLFRGV